ncbi:MAG: hypothetical protein Pg6B_00510 [Candidatus Azobacteroides pseudotrichonymphae]|jgi:membrane-bound ClpP family serine protease|uniref:NfeD-like C-terminal domain-containing protein n=1 Tax=Azobacteroides pseudotrichonymphae genomovar. CFP2 TaxID=511995 RepID=B6YR28_AZOPC|nr:hypothetical protein [Candidatus Azobacteroides pseudotrichonymphae]MDR0529950.1 hypothetical protein [Bacteroidales bacterium OttesenSCG-928-I14]BAG83650.1 conserved hypothetical protein [Candidatus Azobacteroides pseudotrichonymphae genomovar. CFP2]GMO32171.1 MAG: hypothetical protein Pg6B_00510 [Candidatus Azobacteroides pseudotrichonymphae]
MDILIVIILCLLGSVLILLEIFLIPGITFVAIAGIFSTIGGIHYAFDNLGFGSGVIALGSALLIIIAFIIYATNSKSLNKIALETKIESTVAIENTSDISEGDEGIAVSRLNPIGKVEVNNILMEGKSLSNFIDENTKIIVVRVNPTQLIVKIK